MAFTLALWQIVALAAVAAVAVYGVFIAVLVVLGRREAARATAAFVPDCALLFKRLLWDSRVPRRKKLVRGSGREVIEANWPGPPASLGAVLWFAGHPR